MEKRLFCVLMQMLMPLRCYVLCIGVHLRLCRYFMTCIWWTCSNIIVRSISSAKNTQWRRQFSKGVISRSENHLARSPGCTFFPQNKTNKAVIYGNIFIFCSHYYRSKAIRRARQGGARAWARAWARAVDLLASAATENTHQMSFRCRVLPGPAGGD